MQSCFNMSKRHPHLPHCPHTSLIGALVGFALGGNSKRTISNYLQSWAWPQVVSLSDGSELQNWEESGHISRVTPSLGMRLGNIHSGLSALGTAQRLQNANAATPAGFWMICSPRGQNHRLERNYPDNFFLQNVVFSQGSSQDLFPRHTCGSERQSCSPEFTQSWDLARLHSPHGKQLLRFLIRV